MRCVFGQPPTYFAYLPLIDLMLELVFSEMIYSLIQNLKGFERRYVDLDSTNILQLLVSIRDVLFCPYPPCERKGGVIVAIQRDYNHKIFLDYDLYNEPPTQGSWGSRTLLFGMDQVNNFSKGSTSV
uniref:uncharacterized protein LOC122598321 n=1 Tax=Erigeron canadensis TaxID=72917 RepID=UPI001CB8D27D|nr:uncharacterized protein LOC122598321 [Erigeron canadensis]